MRSDVHPWRGYRGDGNAAGQKELDGFVMHRSVRKHVNYSRHGCVHLRPLGNHRRDIILLDVLPNRVLDRFPDHPPDDLADLPPLQHRPTGDPTFYFLFDATETEAAIDQLGRALLVGALLLTLLAVLAAGAVTRGVLRPVRDASAAAGRIAGGDLSARLPVASRDEFGEWAATFNRRRWSSS